MLRLSLDDPYGQCKKLVEKLRTQIIAKQKQNIEDNPTPLQNYSAKNLNNTNDDFRLRCRRILRGHYGKIYSLTCNIYGDIATISQDLKMIVWKTENGNKKAIVSLDDIFQMTAAYSPDGQFVAIGGLDNSSKIYKLQDHTKICTLSGHNGYISCNRYISDTLLLTASGDATINLWNVETEKKKKVHFLDINQML